MYSFPNKPEKITFDWLFDRINQEDVYLLYLGFCDLNKKFTNPLRSDDNNPDCSFYWKTGILFFTDFAFKTTYTCVSVVMKSRGINYAQALDEIYNTFLGGKKTKDLTIIVKTDKQQGRSYKDIKVKIQPFTVTDKQYLMLFGLNSELCKLYKVFSIEYYWIDDKLVYNYNNYNPVIGYYFNGRWKLYHYKSSKKEFRFIGNTSHKDLQGYDQLNWVGELLVITKSLKDVMVYRKFGINSVAPHSEGVSKWVDKIPSLQKRFERVIINFDNDKAGIEATKEVLKLYPLESFFIPDEKDISDYYKKYGEEKTKQIIKGL
jgi:hypothetical protein